MKDSIPLVFREIEPEVYKFVDDKIIEATQALRVMWMGGSFAFYLAIDNAIKEVNYHIGSAEKYDAIRAQAISLELIEKEALRIMGCATYKEGVALAVKSALF